jgi:tRNA(Ile)-lysidine synthase
MIILPSAVQAILCLAVRSIKARVAPGRLCTHNGGVMRDEDNAPISVQEAKKLFADWRGLSAIVLAVSGGPDSVALMWLVARWRRALARGPRFVAVTIDHGLRDEAAREARDVKHLARDLGIDHRTLRWTGDKPRSAVPASAREARYRLLGEAARAAGARHIFTAHTRDDQAETLLMRLVRGSGIAGLGAMARETAREGTVVARPLLTIPKSRLIATLKRAKIAYADDPTNRDPAFTRPRLRALLPQLADEGGDARVLARLAHRLARANAAIDVLVDGAERYLLAGGYLSTPRAPDTIVVDAGHFVALPEEVRLRLLIRAINAVGHEGPAELGKVEALLATLDRALSRQPSRSGRGSAGKSTRNGLKQTLAGALISLTASSLRIEAAPRRRHRADGMRR